MSYQDNLTQYGFGQLGSGYTTNGDEVTPPAEKVIVAISVVLSCQFEELVADTSGYTKADGSEGIAYFGGTDVNMNGAGSQAVPAGEIFPAGITIYGRWTKVELSSGAAILYYGT